LGSHYGRRFPIVSYSLSPEGKVLFHGPPGLKSAVIRKAGYGDHDRPPDQEMFEKVLEPMLRRYGLAIPVTASDRLKARHPRSPKLG